MNVESISRPEKLKQKIEKFKLFVANVLRIEAEPKHIYIYINRSLK